MFSLPKSTNNKLELAVILKAIDRILSKVYS